MTEQKPQLKNETIILDQPHQIEAFRLLALKGALKLEIAGLRSNRINAYATIKREFGFKGNKQKVLEQYEQHLRDIGVLRD